MSFIHQTSLNHHSLVALVCLNIVCNRMINKLNAYDQIHWNPQVAPVSLNFEQCTACFAPSKTMTKDSGSSRDSGSPPPHNASGSEQSWKYLKFAGCFYSSATILMRLLCSNFCRLNSSHLEAVLCVIVNGKRGAVRGSFRTMAWLKFAADKAESALLSQH